MIDFGSLVSSPIFDIYGAPAVITIGGTAANHRVLDHRDGMPVDRAGNVKLLPGISAESATVVIQQSKCPVKPTGGTIRINGENRLYTIKNAVQDGLPGKGDWVLVLEKTT